MSLGIKVKNDSDVNIIAQVTWGYSPITAEEIDKGNSGTLTKNMGWVWYDLTIKNAKTTGSLLRQNGVYASSSWKFLGEAGQYRLEAN